MKITEEIDISKLNKVINGWDILKDNFNNDILDTLKKYKKRLGNSNVIKQTLKKKNYDEIGEFGRYYYVCKDIKYIKYIPNIIKDEDDKKIKYEQLGISLAHIKREIKKYLCCDLYYDIDMVNCHSVIIECLMKKYNLSTRYIGEYNNNRDKYMLDILKKEPYLKTLSGVKDHYCSMLYSEFSNTRVDIFQKIHSEIYNTLYPILEKDEKYKKVCFQKTYNISTDDNILKDDNVSKDKNTKGSAFSLIIHDIETDIMESVFDFLKKNKIKIGTYEYDGFKVYKNSVKNIDKLISKLNSKVFELTGYNVSFKNKEMSYDVSLFGKLDPRKNSVFSHILENVNNENINIENVNNENINIENVNIIENINNENMDEMMEEDYENEITNIVNMAKEFNLHKESKDSVLIYTNSIYNYCINNELNDVYHMRRFLKESKEDVYEVMKLLKKNEDKDPLKQIRDRINEISNKKKPNMNNMDSISQRENENSILNSIYTSDVYESIEYKQQKQKWEEIYFKNLGDARFYEINNNIVKSYTKNQIFEKYEHITIPTKTGLKPFLNYWCRDNKMKTYNEVIFYLDGDISKKSSNIFNLFRGFDVNNIKEIKEITENMLDDLEFLKNHIKMLCNNEDKVYKYMLWHLNKILLKPGQRNNISVLIKSVEGVGKGLLIQLLRNIIGKQYVFMTSQMETLFGRFTSILKDKIIVCADEISEGQFKFYKPIILSYTANEEIALEEKGISLSNNNYIRNYVHFFFFSNEKFPITLSENDRRFLVIGCDVERPSQEYIARLVKVINDENIQRMFYEWIISDENKKPEDKDWIASLPETELRSELKKTSRSEEECFFRRYINKCRNNDIQKIYVNEIYNEFKNNSKNNISLIKFGIITSKINIKGLIKNKDRNGAFYEINNEYEFIDYD